MGDARLGAVVRSPLTVANPSVHGRQMALGPRRRGLRGSESGRWNRLATVSAAGPADVDEAIEAAWSAFGQWSSPLREGSSGRLATGLADLVEARADEIATLESLDRRKPVSDAYEFDVPSPASGLPGYCCRRLRACPPQ